MKTFIWDETFRLAGQVSLQHSTRAVTPGWALCVPAKIPALSLWGQPGAVAAALLQAGHTHEGFAGRFGAVTERFGALQVGATPGTAADPDEG